MKRRDLVQTLADLAKSRGEQMRVTEGGRHTKVQIGRRRTTVPRHNEINERTARSIIKHMEGS